MKYLILVSILLTLMSCASLRAPYAPYTKENLLGYADIKNDDQTDAVRFRGNMFTEPLDMVLYSQFRAIQICQSRGKTLTRFLKMTDMSPSTSIQSAEGYRQYVPVYLKYDVSYNATSVRENILEGSIDPVFEVTFTCVDKAYSAQVVVRELVAGEVKSFVQDARGAVQINAFHDVSVSAQSLKVDDIILKVNGTRSRNRSDFYRLVDMSENGKTLLTVIRERKVMDIEVLAASIENQVEEFELRIVRTACQKEELKNQPVCLK